MTDTQRLREGVKDAEAKEERASLLFLLGSVQGSQSGGKPALKRPLFKPSLASCIVLCVLDADVKPITPVKASWYTFMRPCGF